MNSKLYLQLKMYIILGFQSLILIFKPLLKIFQKFFGLCGKQTEIEPEYSLLRTTVHYQQAKTIHTTQANEINVCTEHNVMRGENTSHINFRIK